MLSLIKKALKNSAIYGLGNLSAKLVGFVLLPIYTDYLSVDDYGAFALLEATALIMMSIFGGGLYWAFNRWYWDQKYAGKQKSIFFTLLVFLSGVVAILICLTIYFSDGFSELVFGTSKYSYVLRLVSICAGAEILANLFSTLLKLQERPILFSSSNLVKLIINLGLTIYFIMYLGHGVNGIFEAQIFGHLGYFLFMIPVAFKEIHIKFETAILKEMLLFSMPLMLSIISGLVLAQSDRFMLEEMQSIAESGQYSMGFKLANSVKVFIVFSIQLAISPMIYKMMDQPGAKRFYSKIMTYFTFGVIPFSLGASLFGIDLMVWISDNTDYWAAAQVIPIISLTIIFGMLRDTAQIGLNITKKTKKIASVTTIIAALNVGFNYILIPIYGIIGAALATLLCQIIAFGITYRVSQKEYFIPFEIGKIFMILFTAISLYIISKYVDILNTNINLLLKLLLIFCYPLILYFLNFYEKAELETVKNKLKQLKKNLLGS